MPPNDCSIARPKTAPRPPDVSRAPAHTRRHSFTTPQGPASDCAAPPEEKQHVTLHADAPSASVAAAAEPAAYVTRAIRPHLPAANPPQLETLAELSPFLQQTAYLLAHALSYPARVRVLAPLLAFAPHTWQLTRPSRIEQVVIEVMPATLEEHTPPRMLARIAQAMDTAWQREDYPQRWGERHFVPSFYPPETVHNGIIGNIVTQDARWQTLVTYAGRIPALRALAPMSVLANPFGFAEDVAGLSETLSGAQKLHQIANDWRSRRIGLTAIPTLNDLATSMMYRALGLGPATQHDAAFLCHPLRADDPQRLVMALRHLVFVITHGPLPQEILDEIFEADKVRSLRLVSLLNLATLLAYEAPTKLREVLDKPRTSFATPIALGIAQLTPAGPQRDFVTGLLSLLANPQTRRQLQFISTLCLSLPQPTAQNAAELAQPLRVRMMPETRNPLLIERMSVAQLDAHLCALAALSPQMLADEEPLEKKLATLLGIDERCAWLFARNTSAASGLLPWINQLMCWCHEIGFSNRSHERLAAALSVMLRHTDSLVRPQLFVASEDGPPATQSPFAHETDSPSSARISKQNETAPAVVHTPDSADNPAARPLQSASTSASAPTAKTRQPAESSPPKPPATASTPLEAVPFQTVVARPRARRAQKNLPQLAPLTPKSAGKADNASSAQRKEHKPPALPASLVVTAIRPAAMLPSRSPSLSPRSVPLPASPQPKGKVDCFEEKGALLAAPAYTTLDDVLGAYSDACSALCAWHQSHDKNSPLGAWLTELVQKVSQNQEQCEQLVSLPRVFGALCQEPSCDGPLMNVLQRVGDVVPSTLERWLSARGARNVRINGLRLLVDRDRPLYTTLTLELLQAVRVADEPQRFIEILDDLFEHPAHAYAEESTLQTIAHAALGMLGRATTEFRDAIANRMGLQTAWLMRKNAPLASAESHAQKRGSKIIGEIHARAKQEIVEQTKTFLLDGSKKSGEAWFHAGQDLSKLWQIRESFADYEFIGLSRKFVGSALENKDLEVHIWGVEFFTGAIAEAEKSGERAHLSKLLLGLVADLSTHSLTQLANRIKQGPAGADILGFLIDTAQSLLGGLLGHDAARLCLAAQTPLAPISDYEGYLGMSLFLRRLNPEGDRILSERDFQMLFADEKTQAHAMQAELLRRTLDVGLELKKATLSDMQREDLKTWLDDAECKQKQYVARLGHVFHGALKAAKHSFEGLTARCAPDPSRSRQEAQKLGEERAWLVMSTVRAAAIMHKLGLGEQADKVLTEMWQSSQIRDLTLVILDKLFEATSRLSRQPVTQDFASVLRALVRTETRPELKPDLVLRWRRAFNRQQPLEYGQLVAAQNAQPTKP